jgi:predicted ATP-dependent protease
LADRESLTLLPPEALRRSCDPSSFAFRTTEELPPPETLVGHERAAEALRFGIDVSRGGYNIFALGSTGVGKHDVVRRFLEERAAARAVPSEWCYVHNFAEPHRPRAVELPAGRASALAADADRLVGELRAALPAAFQGEDYRTRRKLLEARFKEENERAFEAIEKRAAARGIALVRTPVGVALAPVRNGEVIEPEEFQRLPEAQQEALKAEMGSLQEELRSALAELPRLEREHREKLRTLDREVTAHAVKHLLEDVRARWADLPAVLAHFEAVEADILAHTEDFLPSSGEMESLARVLGRPGPRENHDLRRYRVNVLVDRRDLRGAPVVYEDHPGLANLLGRVEHRSELGSLVTDFTLIKPGALHRANGGYLVLDARKLLTQPYAWDELKRALRARQVRIESLGQMLSLVTTITLDPEPVALDVKVVLVGERRLYYLLSTLDPEFPDLFKVAADFDDELPRDAGGEARYARLLGELARQESLRPLDPTAVARLVEHGARLAGDAGKLSTRVESLLDVLREADHRAGASAREVIDGVLVTRSIEAQRHRLSRVKERLEEEIRRGTILIDTGGRVAGQVNGLSVLQLGELAFGRPTRITARVRLGTGKVTDIEREVELGGPIHSKGVLILGSFLASRYAAERPLALSASLVFEQSYAGVEGDSASCAELVALLSALGDMPVDQALAVTGSVNQLGQVQAVGGVNEKVEGFFDVCQALGLTGRQGVVLPRANAKDLMLREDVVAAARDGRFRVFAVSDVDEAAEVLTGVSAGARGPDGRFPEGSLNARVEARLADFAEKARQFRAEKT